MMPASGRRSKIRPPRKSLVSSTIDNSNNNNNDPSLDFEKSWLVLANAINQIQNKNVSNLSYEQLYRKAYVLVIRKYGAKLYDNVGSVITQHLLNRRQYLVSISTGNEEFMKAIIQEWNEHLQAMKFISDVLMYLNRVYVKEQKKLLIYDLGIQLFKDNIIRYNGDEVGHRLVHIVIDEITKSRNKIAITSNMYITKVINMLELLVESTNSEIQYGENYYQTVFEPLFLSSSHDFFTNLSQHLIGYSSGSKYLYEANQFIKDEENRIKFYLPSSTYPKLIELMNNILIKDKIDGIILLPYEQQGLEYWLRPIMTNIFEDKNDTYNYTDFALLYNLIGRIDEDYQLLRARLKEGIINQGKTIPEFVKASIESSGSGGGSATYKKSSSTSSTAFATKWIETIIKYRQQMSLILAHSFDHSPIIEQAITFGMREFINGAPNKRGTGPIQVNAPEMLSIYMDSVIKQLGKGSASKEVALQSGDQIEDFINKSIQFLRFIKDKDAFEANYANHFAKRFLNSKGPSQTITKGINIEELVLSKLSEELGTSSLDKIIKMNKDIKSSKDITNDWKRYITKQDKPELIELELKICNVTDWPKSMTKDYKWFSKTENEDTPFIWPRQLRNTIREFEEFWCSGKKNDNKSLFWTPKFGSMDLRISYPSRTYEINMSTYAGIIMLLFAPQSTNLDGSMVSAFEENKQLTYLEIAERTGIPELELKRHLQSIAVAPKSRLLIKSPMSKDVNESDVFRLNEKFKSPSIKVKVLTVSASSSAATTTGTTATKTSKAKTERQEESEEVQGNILEGRKIQVNAAIVRIMKSRHTVKHHELVEELHKQLSNRFQPSMILIKQRIEDLISKEYLKRDEEDRNIYHYVA
ncbi:uncharacterized protein J8A68_003297 [[Candida] subhashii]|uniref:Cullin family profile domain-containing protein n=1 Tax=[Candida] subhashii TaxID=561895 RepID=A0A8J5UWS4_9ASCO|nr:uncharacterized protein J8A68_003297 [[Candida] subhashii]KAG7663215.1 hypothetical protein J8A68_003297 [[Candida] subhashii]